MIETTAPVEAAPRTDVKFSTREVPWMKLGKLVEHAVSAKDAARIGGIDFNAVERPLYTRDHTGSLVEIKERKALLRDDTDAWLSVVSTGYPVLQYGEAFDFMDSLSPEFVAAGALRGGRQGFMVVRMPDSMGFNVLQGDDPHELFAVLRTSHDRTRAVEVMVMPLRQKCMNQLTLASFTDGVENRWSVQHNGSMKSKLSAAGEAITRVEQYVPAYLENVERLAYHYVPEEKAESILMRVFPDTPRRENKVESVLNAWRTSPTVGFPASGWGLVNAVSEYFEWSRQGGSPESRFVGALQGSTHRAINRTAALVLNA